MSAASANAPSKYNKIELIKKGKQPVELNAGTISVDYYESLYSPIVTANLVFVDAGGNIEDENGVLKPVKEALPLEGNEDLSLKKVALFSLENIHNTHQATKRSGL